MTETELKQPKPNKKFSLNKHFFYTMIATFSVVIISLQYSIFQTYSNHKFEIKKSVAEHLKTIELAFKDDLDYINSIAMFLGGKISIAGSDIKKISLVMTQPFKNTNNSPYSWILFDYVTSDGLLIADSIRGKIDIPIKIDQNKRSWFKTSIETPWAMQTSKNDISITSGEMILPIAFGITDLKNNFIGYLTTGININKLLNKLKSITEKTISFAIFDNYKNIVLKSEDFNIGQDKKHLETKAIKLSHYPFKIIVQSSSDYEKKFFYDVMLNQIIRNAIMTMFLIAVLTYLKLKVVNPVLDLSIYSEKLSKENIEDIDDHKSKEYHIKEFDLIYKNLQNIRKIRLELKKSLDEHKVTRKALEKLNTSLEFNVKQRTIELEQALKTKTRILNNLSHEIRAPIHGANGIAQLLVDVWNDITEEEKLYQIKLVAKNTARLSKFVSNILDLSKFSAGKMKFDFKDIEFISITEDLIEEFNELYIKLKDIKIILKPHGCNKIYLVGDELRISQLLRNILGNAVRYSPQSGHIYIEINYYKDTHNILISVSDEGIGIPKDELDMIFEPFVQSSITTTNAGGTGLGLSICKEIVEAHSGRIWAENIVPTGAKFNIILPVKSINQPTNIETKNNFNSIENFQKTILFIDDENSSHEMFELIAIKHKNINVIGLHSGMEAINMINNIIQNHKIELILLDLMMPDISGLEVLKFIKSNEHTANIPVIVQSGVSESSIEIKDAIMLGAADSISKPYNYSDLIKKINLA